MKNNSNALFTSNSEEWETPQDLFDKLDNIFSFKLDACASLENKKCKFFFTKEQNALEKNWHIYHNIWLNPPYGKDIYLWMEKAYNESLKGCIIVCLVPSRTDTKWWHEWVKKKGLIYFIKRRLKFNNAKNSAPFPSAIVIYGFDIDRIINS